jgi:hypothetical protein
MVGRYFPETFYSSAYTINKSGTSTGTNEIPRQTFESSKNTAESKNSNRSLGEGARTGSNISWKLQNNPTQKTSASKL